MLPLLPPASAGTATSEADQNKIAPVPGIPERLGAEGLALLENSCAVSQQVSLAGVLDSPEASSQPRPAKKLITRFPSRTSMCAELVTTSAIFRAKSK